MQAVTLNTNLGSLKLELYCEQVCYDVTLNRQLQQMYGLTTPLHDRHQKQQKTL